jgi:hypothetical protein
VYGTLLVFLFPLFSMRITKCKALHAFWAV